MGAELFLAFPELRSWLESGSEVAGTIYRPRTFDDERRQKDEEALKDTRAAQPALGLIDLATHRVLKKVGVMPSMAAGHSYGEVAALAAERGDPRRGPLAALEEARGGDPRRVQKRGGDPGTMAAVSASAEVVEKHVGQIEGLVLANLNAPSRR